MPNPPHTMAWRACEEVKRAPRVPKLAPTLSGAGRRTRPRLAAGRDVLERHVLVHAHLLGQPQHPLGDDVAHDLIGAAGDPYAGGAEQGLLEERRERGKLRVVDDP